MDKSCVSKLCVDKSCVSKLCVCEQNQHQDESSNLGMKKLGVETLKRVEICRLEGS